MVIYITKMDDCGDVFDALKRIVVLEHEHMIEAMNGRTDHARSEKRDSSETAQC